jgi:hypothetical protein
LYSFSDESSLDEELEELLETLDEFEEDYDLLL